MSLSDRARLAALVELERDADSELRTHLLGAIGRAEPGRGAPTKARELPETWTPIHALDRLEEAFAVLSALPARVRPKQYGNAMPTVVQERPSLKDLLDMEGQFEQDRNRVRLAPTAAQITRMDQALRWPTEYLQGFPEVGLSLCRRALWAAHGADISNRCKAYRLNPKFFHRQWQHGLTIITMRLISRRVPVS